MVKLTRLNNQVIVVNADHICGAEAAPDTTLRLANGERIIVKETIDQLIGEVVAYRRRIGVAQGHDAVVAAMTPERHGDDARVRGGV
ncbi:MAG: flagellar FlbD family protein [Labilithrix sp.]|nr:flagellar FlbD family protein [Labilithrix sp.]